MTADQASRPTSTVDTSRTKEPSPRLSPTNPLPGHRPPAKLPTTGSSRDLFSDVDRLDINRAAVLHRPGQLRILTVDQPPCGDREALVEIRVVGISDSDASYFGVGQSGNTTVNGSIVLGQEASGLVRRTGSHVTSVKAGDRVLVRPTAPCRTCPSCAAGFYEACPTPTVLARPPHNGALQRHVAVHENDLVPLPDQLNYEQGCLLGPLAVAVRACHRVAHQPGDDLLIIGAGTVGLLAAQVCRALGANSVTISDSSAFRLNLARQQGFSVEPTFTPAQSSFDALLECTGSARSLLSGLRRLRHGGRAALVGENKTLSVAPLDHFAAAELTISLVSSYVHTFDEAIDLVATGRVDPALIITHHFGLDQTEAALTTAQHPGESSKVVVHPQQTKVRQTE